MNIAVLIILIVVGGIILWGALTGWTFSGIFGGRGDDAEGDSPPGPISNVQVGVATGKSGGRRESYTTAEEMEGLSITISFNTPKSFGRGDLALRDYIISLGITNDDSRGDLLAVIVIPRNAATVGARLITENKDISAPGGIALFGDFNARDSRVSVTLSSPVWGDGEIVIREGGVFLGIDYTPMKLTEDYKWPGDQKYDKPAGDDTRKFISGGVTLIGQVEDDAGFVVDPDVTDSINEQLDIAVEAFETTDDVGGAVVIGKRVGKSSRFLISPFHRQDIFFGFSANGGKGIEASILGKPLADCNLDTFRGKPSFWTDNISFKINLGASPTVSEDDFWNPESNWFNFAIMEEHKVNEVPTGWVRLGLISNFVSDGTSGGRIKIKRPQFPVIHPVSLFTNPTPLYLAFHTSDEDDVYTPTYFKFVSPLDSSDPQGGKKFSLCIRKETDDLSASLSAEDLFLVYTVGGSANIQRLKDIDDLSMAVFTKRNPDSGPVDLDCDPTVTAYDPVQAEGENSLTFKGSCGTSDIVGAELGFGLSGCQLPETIKTLCDGTPGCIGYRTYKSSGCSGLLMNTPPVCKRYSEQVYGDIGGKTLNASTGKLDDGPHQFYLNGLCLGDPDARYKKWGDPLNPVGGGCNSDINVHKAACSANPYCVGFQFHTDGNRTNNCSHFLRKKTTHTYTADLAGSDRPGHDLPSGASEGGSLEDCKNLCSEKDECVGFSYRADPKRCALKGDGVKGSELAETGYTFYSKNAN
jgi:hypothetical protein